MDIPNSPLRSVHSADDQEKKTNGTVVDKLEAMVSGEQADVKSAGV